MKGSDFIASLPEKFSPEREQMILDAVRRGDYVLNWVPLTIVRPPYSATIWVSNDALRIGDPADSVRVSVSAETEQKIADELNATMPTALISDEIYRQAHIKLKPVPLGTENMSTTTRMKLHHDRVEEQLIPWYDAPLSMPVQDMIIAPVGKDWVASTRLRGEPYVQGAPAAINYGWQREDMQPAAHTGPFPSVSAYPPVVVHQSEGMAHNMKHEDYSQVVRLVARAMLICLPKDVAQARWPWVSAASSTNACKSGETCTLSNGEEGVTWCMDIYDVAQDDVLNPLVSHNGPVYMRQPGVPYEMPLGQHAIWGGLTPTPPPSWKLVDTPKGEVQPDAPVPMPPEEAPPPGFPPPLPTAKAGLSAASKGLLVVGGAVAGWWVAGRLIRL